MPQATEHEIVTELAVEVLVMPGDDIAWHRIRKRFTAVGISSLQRFDAIDGASLRPDQLLQCLTPRAAYELSVGRRYPFGWVHEGIPSVGAVGCYLSHVELWKRAAGRTVPTLILEQDAEPAASPAQLVEALATIPLGIDAVFLGHLAIHKPRLVEMFSRKPAKGFYPVQPTSDVFCTHAYLVTPGGAAKLARNALPVNAQVDGYMKFMCTPDSEVCMVFHSPSLVRQRAGVPSAVQASRSTVDRVLQGGTMALQALSNAAWVQLRRPWWLLCRIFRRQDESVHSPDQHRPDVSVLLPTYNVSAFIGEAIESVLEQNYGDFELLVMDDGSTDKTAEIAESYDDPRLVVRRCEHRGPTRTMNDGIDRARGRFIAFLDGDDTWAPGKLACHVELMTNQPQLDLTFCRSRMIDEQGKTLPISSPRWSGVLSYRQLLVSNPAANGSSIVVLRTALLSAGKFDTDFTASYDHELWLRVALLRPANMVCIPEKLTCYRRRSGQITADPQVMEKGWQQLIEKHRQINPEIVNRLESKSRSNVCRYLAAIACETGDTRLGMSYLAASLKSDPGLFLRTRRSYMVAGALLVRGISKHFSV